MQKKLTFFLGLVILLILTGCWTLSIHPLYFEKDLIFIPGLIGTWSDKKTDDGTSNPWIFEKSGENVYRLIMKEKNKSDGLFKAHLLRLGKYLFLDLFPEEPEEGDEFYIGSVIPAHSFLRVSLEDQVLRLGYLDPDWLKKNIDDQKIKIKHERRDDLLILTASTKDLQEFVLKHVEEAFEFESGVLYRQQ